MGESFNCSDCGKEYSSLSGMKYHLKEGSDTCSGHECPDCGADWFFKRNGLAVHYAEEHGGTLASTDIECDQCGKPVDKSKSQVERSEKHYCSRECHQKDKGTDVILECEICGGEINTMPSRKDRRRTCSYECQSELFSQEYTGANSPTWKGGDVELECEICDDTFRSTPAVADRRATCSRDCRNEYLSQTYSGEDSHEWKGGSKDYYGPNWRQIRDEIIERDSNTCQICGVHGNELEFGLDVHHIQSMRKFKREYDRPVCFEKANKKYNLISLCRRCHAKWEGVPIMPQT